MRELGLPFRNGVVEYVNSHRPGGAVAAGERHHAQPNDQHADPLRGSAGQAARGHGSGSFGVGVSRMAGNVSPVCDTARRAASATRLQTPWSRDSRRREFGQRRLRRAMRLLPRTGASQPVFRECVVSNNDATLSGLLVRLRFDGDRLCELPGRGRA